MMVERITKRFLMAEVSGELEGSLDKVIEALQEWKAKADAGGYSEVGLEMIAREAYGDAYIEAEIYGMRLETEEEAAEREARNERARQQQLDYARRQYEQLKAQFGDA